MVYDAYVTVRMNITFAKTILLAIKIGAKIKVLGTYHRQIHMEAYIAEREVFAPRYLDDKISHFPKISWEKKYVFLWSNERPSFIL